jgi:DNA polymerase-3 subunit delta
MMLAPLRARVERGDSVDGVMAAMGKSLFWKDKTLVQRLLTQWSAERIAQAMTRVAALERQLLLSNAPDEASLGETLVTLARVGQRR